MPVPDGVRRPKFVTHAAGPDLSIVGSAMGPQSYPINTITVSPSGNAAYEQVFTDIGPDGQFRTVGHPGTWGMLVAACKGARY